jgi:hypothetical protein
LSRERVRELLASIGVTSDTSEHTLIKNLSSLKEDIDKYARSLALLRESTLITDETLKGVVDKLRARAKVLLEAVVESPQMVDIPDAREEEEEEEEEEESGSGSGSSSGSGSGSSSEDE